MPELSLMVARPLGFMVLAFILSVLLMPLLIRALKRLGMGKTIRDAASAPVMAALHKAKAGTPVMGGIMIWGIALFLAGLGGGLCWIFGNGWCDLTFLSRGQTLLPLGSLLGAALVGLVDDYLNVKKIGPKGGGLRMRYKILSYLLVAAIGAWWFYAKLGWDQVHVPFVGTFEIGWWYIPFFILVITSTSYSVNETDGLDGLAGGSLLAAFGAYLMIAYGQGRTDLAVLCAVVIGALLGFLWFNVNPASVFMGDTGSMSLGTLLGVVACMTNQPLLLLIIGLPFVVQSGSVLLQVASKKLRHGKKIFLSSPIHHHFQALGWPEQQIVMRFWLISFICAGVGAVIALVDLV
ncbi:MAG: phospho-N-acetylmuramoyl-pentapeptide-transferase [Patescibacteria group bacterium]